jgi:hypothetical protein
VKAIYTATGTTFNGLTLPPNSVKTAYVITWPACLGANNTFELVARVKWELGSRDLTALLNGVDAEEIKDNAGTTIGVKITKPFEFQVFFPQTVTVDTVDVDLVFDNTPIDDKGTIITITSPKCGQIIDIDPVVAIDPEDTASSAGTIVASLFALFCLLALLF